MFATAGKRKVVTFMYIYIATCISIIDSYLLFTYSDRYVHMYI